MTQARSIPLTEDELEQLEELLVSDEVPADCMNMEMLDGYLAAIVAASNAGGSGSVVGDTTTTLMWIDGVNPLHVLHAYVAAAVALVLFGFFICYAVSGYVMVLVRAGRRRPAANAAPAVPPAGISASARDDDTPSA